MEKRDKKLTAIARQTRLHVLDMINASRGAHIGSNFSSVEILTALYFGGFLNVHPKHPHNPNRDRFILSKGHGAAALYATLAQKGFFPEKILEQYCRNGSTLFGHASRALPGIEVSSGSLGHGLSLANGMALAGKRDKKHYRVVALLSDGECDEGSTWEAILFAGHHHLDNLIVIVDYNKWQSFGRTKEVLNLEPFTKKWKDFNCSTKIGL